MLTEEPRTSSEEGSPAEPTLAELDTDAQQGLSEEEASRRLEQHGRNTIEERRRSPVVKMLAHFWGPIPWMIELACVLAAVAQRWENFCVILALLLINVGVSFWHEHKADRSIKALKERLAPTARVIRGGQRRKIDATELVPGDVVQVRIGDVIPADARLVEDAGLSVDESSLTGESLPVGKQEGETLYSGTAVKRGNGRAVVAATGSDTKFASTVKLVEAAGAESHFRKAVLRIGYFLIVFALVLIVATSVVSIFVRHDDPWMVVMFALGLMLAAIPAALPAVLSVTMSVGANRLARMKAVVSRLSAMDEMAGLDVLCADKTGTLTKNELKLGDPVLLNDHGREEVVRVAALTADREEPDPIDEAILKAVEAPDDLDAYEVLDFTPFDPTHKRAEAKVRRGDETFRAAKGAPQAILNLVGADDAQREQVVNKVNDLAGRGLRALGVASKGQDADWTYLGILSLLDPPREDSAQVIDEAHAHHIDVHMVTGDHPAIAKEIARQVGMGDRIIEAGEIFKESGDGDGKTSRSTHETVVHADGFAEVTPEHKYQIIKHLQADDHIVGMTGDGVNDAPALKQADVGIAVADATDAARSASAVVLTEQGLGVIIRGIEEARRIFERMTGYATYRITETIRLLLFITTSVLVFNFYPVTPLMIVLLAILNDIPIMVIAWDNARTPKKPVRWAMPRVLITATMLGLAGVASSFLLFFYLQEYAQLSAGTIQTMMFLKLLVAGHMTLYITRAIGWLWQKPWPNWKLILALEVTQVGGTLVAIYGVLMQPIGWKLAGLVWLYAIAWMFILDAVKIGVHRILRDVVNWGELHTAAQPA
jgi:H+-transporting ATPase